MLAYRLGHQVGPDLTWSGQATKPTKVAIEQYSLFRLVTPLGALLSTDSYRYNSIQPKAAQSVFDSRAQSLRPWRRAIRSCL